MSLKRNNKRKGRFEWRGRNEKSKEILKRKSKGKIRKYK